MLLSHPGTQHFLLDMINVLFNTKTPLNNRVLSHYVDFEHLKHKFDTAGGAEAQLNGLRWKRYLWGFKI